MCVRSPASVVYSLLSVMYIRKAPSNLMKNLLSAISSPSGIFSNKPLASLNELTVALIDHFSRFKTVWCRANPEAANRR